MPSHEIHNFVDEWLFGRSYPRLHEAIDIAVHFYGRGHRRFFHTQSEVIGIAMFLFPGDFDAILAALFHLIVDDLCSKDPSWEEWFKLQVEEKKEAKKRNKRFSKMLEAFFVQLNRNNELCVEMLVKNSKQQMEANTKLMIQLLGDPKKKKRKRKKKKRLD